MDPMMQNVLLELECPVCVEYMIPPMTMCDNGHSVCNSCRQRLNVCPTCMSSFTKIRNIALENLARKVQYPCKYAEYGCKEVFLLSDNSKHQEDCAHRPLECPFFITEIKCGWKGIITDIKGHVRSTHTRIGDSRNASGTYLHNPTDLRRNAQWWQVVYTLDEMFFHFSKTTEDIFYSCILYVGNKSNADKYKYKLTFDTSDSSQKFVASFKTSSHIEDIDEIMDNEQCVVLALQFCGAVHR